MESIARKPGPLTPAKAFAFENDVFILELKQDKPHVRSSCVLVGKCGLVRALTHRLPTAMRVLSWGSLSGVCRWERGLLSWVWLPSSHVFCLDAKGIVGQLMLPNTFRAPCMYCTTIYVCVLLKKQFMCSKLLHDTEQNYILKVI